MSINNEEALAIIEKLESFEKNELLQNYISQAQSRHVLLNLKAPSNSWPAYSQFERDIQETSYYFFWQGLQLKTTPEYRLRGDEYIKKGCELLEFLYLGQAVNYPERTRQLFNAALGYYISGYYARSFVLMRDLETNHELPNELILLKHLFEKDLTELRSKIILILENPEFSDSAISERLGSGEYSEEDALHQIFQASFNRAISFFIEYPKTGDDRLIERAREISETGAQLALKTNFIDWWWLFYCIQFFFDEYYENSLWTNLPPMGSNDQDKNYIEKFIYSSYSRRIPIIELWRSQIIALAKINSPQRDSFCLRMPTSAGKTRVAEITILRFLLDFKDNPQAKCLYIAPFRSLAIEIESSLQESFHPLGARVSELYGGFEFNPIERLLFDETRVIVATPEKIDAFLRYNQDLSGQIKLIILDEGHIINLTDRGLRYEMFLQRIIRQFARNGVRFQFISAVLPNTDEFANWITGDSSSVVQSDWRPSRILLGEINWTGKNARIDYLESDHLPFLHDCYVPNFIRQINPVGLPGIRFRKPFPSDINEVVAEAGVQFALDGTTMIFCARKASVVPVARCIEKSIMIKKAIAKANNEDFSLPVFGNAQSEIQKCIDLANEYMGMGNDVSTFLLQGVAIHHGDIPKPVRIQIEKIIRNGMVNLFVATTTLAQGVNLPVQTVIVHGLSHGYSDTLSPLTFWNTCGRAGRGMKENQGQVLFAVDLNLPNVGLTKQLKERLSELAILRIEKRMRQERITRDEQIRKTIVEGYHSYRLISALQQLFQVLIENWQEAFPEEEFIELVNRLAENDLSWMNDDVLRSKTGGWLDVLDAELLALVEESKIEIISPDVLQELMAGSLLYIQLEADKENEKLQDKINELIHSRWRYVNTISDTLEKRKRFYSLGFPIHDCNSVDQNLDELLALISSAEEYVDWSVEQQCEFLVTLANWIFAHVTVLEPQDSPCFDCWDRILSLWLQGFSPNEIVGDETVASLVTEPTIISQFVEDAFSYKLSWGINAINAYIGAAIDNTGDNLSAISSYFSAFYKYGVCSPISCFLLASGLESRKLAQKLSVHYEEDHLDLRNILSWVVTLTVEQLNEMGLTNDEINLIITYRKSSLFLSDQLTKKYQEKDVVLNVSSEYLDSLSVNEILLFVPQSDISPETFSILTLFGDEIGSYEYESAIPDQWKKYHRTLVTVREFNKDKKQVTITIRVL